MKVITIFLVSVLLISCNSSDKNSESTTSKEPVQEQSSVTNCYSYTANNDTVTLKIIHVGESITGTLVYNLYQKDKNIGTIQGAMKDDILIADYTFMAEGMQSVRQVAFKLAGNSFIEGYGESIDKDGKMIFKNSDSLTFSSTMKLSEIPCQ